MAKFIQLARCYYNDKDVYDILANPRYSTKVLLNVARERGILLSNDDSREEIIRYLALQYFDWTGLNSLTARLNYNESEERRSTVRLESVSSLDVIEKAAKLTQEKLPEGRESAHVKKVGNRLVLTGQYVAVDPTRSKGMQREVKGFTVEFEVDNGAIKAEFTHSPKAAGVVADIVKQLQGQEGTKGAKITRIALSGIKDPILRTNFLLGIRNHMAEFRALDVLDLNVDHRFEVELEKDDEEKDAEENSVTKKAKAKEEDSSEVAEVKTMLRSAALHGNGLLTNELYQNLQKKGYYIYKLVWSAKELGGAGRVMEFESGFDNPVPADGFSYDVKRILPTEAEKEAGKTQHELLIAERPRVRRMIADAAYKSLQAIEKLAAKAAKK